MNKRWLNSQNSQCSLQLCPWILKQRHLGAGNRIICEVDPQSLRDQGAIAVPVTGGGTPRKEESE